MKKKNKYEIHISVSGNAVLELEEDTELMAEIKAERLLEAGKVDWSEYDLDIMAVKV